MVIVQYLLQVLILQVFQSVLLAQEGLVVQVDPTVKKQWHMLKMDISHAKNGNFPKKESLQEKQLMITNFFGFFLWVIFEQKH